MFPFHSRALTNSDSQLVPSHACRRHSVPTTSTRMLQKSSRHPTPCTALGVAGSPSQAPSSFGRAAGWFLLSAWTPPPPTGSGGGGSSAPSSTPPSLSLSLPWALYHLQSHLLPLQPGSAGHGALIPPPPSLRSQIASAHMFVSKTQLWKHTSWQHIPQQQEGTRLPSLCCLSVYVPSVFTKCRAVTAPPMSVKIT